MKRKTVLPAAVSRAIRSFGVPRGVLVELLFRLHEGIPRDYEVSRHHRMEDGRYFLHRIAISTEGDGEHLFVVVVDDTTSPDFLQVARIGHGIL